MMKVRVSPLPKPAALNSNPEVVDQDTGTGWAFRRRARS